MPKLFFSHSLAVEKGRPAFASYFPGPILIALDKPDIRVCKWIAALGGEKTGLPASRWPKNR
jgi:hypothetical protein